MDGSLKRYPSGPRPGRPGTETRDDLPLRTMWEPVQFGPLRPHRALPALPPARRRLLSPRLRPRTSTARRRRSEPRAPRSRDRARRRLRRTGLTRRGPRQTPPPGGRRAGHHAARVCPHPRCAPLASVCARSRPTTRTPCSRCSPTPRPCATGTLPPGPSASRPAASSRERNRWRTRVVGCAGSRARLRPSPARRGRSAFDAIWRSSAIRSAWSSGGGDVLEGHVLASLHLRPSDHRFEGWVTHGHQGASLWAIRQAPILGADHWKTIEKGSDDHRRWCVRRIGKPGLDRSADAQIVAGSRTPEQVAVERSVLLDRPTTWRPRHAIGGADPLLLGSAGYGEDDVVIARHGAAIEAAEQAGVGHIVYTSLTGAGDHLAFALPHRWTERRLKAGSADWTILRNGIHAESASPARRRRLDRCLAGLFADGRLAAVAREELAAVTARILADPAEHVGRIYELVGTRAVGGVDIAEAVAGATGTAVTYDPAPWRSCARPRRQRRRPRLAGPDRGVHLLQHRGGLPGGDRRRPDRAARPPPRPAVDVIADSFMASVRPWVRSIGAPGFEPGTSATQRRRATRLRHAPTGASVGRRGGVVDGPIRSSVSPMADVQPLKALHYDLGEGRRAGGGRLAAL